MSFYIGAMALCGTVALAIDDLIVTHEILVHKMVQCEIHRNKLWMYSKSKENRKRINSAKLIEGHHWTMKLLARTTQFHETLAKSLVFLSQTLSARTLRLPFFYLITSRTACSEKIEGKNVKKTSNKLWCSLLTLNL